MNATRHAIENAEKHGFLLTKEECDKAMLFGVVLTPQQLSRARIKRHSSNQYVYYQGFVVSFDSVQSTVINLLKIDVWKYLPEIVISFAFNH